jgi:transposase
LHPNPTKNREIPACGCQHCGADVSQAPQVACEAYDHIELPPIKPDVTRVALYCGTCPDCGKKFKASPPPDMPKGSPFGENLRALVLYLRFTQNIALERLSTLLSTILGLEISEGAIVNILSASRDAFAAQREASAQGCCRERSCNRTRPACVSARTVGICGCSTTRTAASSSQNPPGRRLSSESFSATSARITGPRIAIPASWDGPKRKINSRASTSLDFSRFKPRRLDASPVSRTAGCARFVGHRSRRIRGRGADFEKRWTGGRILARGNA